MITCKEDLINTYIEDDHGELRDIYLSIAEKFGFLIDEGDYTLGIISVMKDCKYVQDINSIELVRKCKKLTLSDLNPRTRTEYEKVTESIFDLKDEFERGELYIQLLGDSGEYRAIEEESTLIDEMRDDNVYRKVEKPIEWWEDAADYLSDAGFKADGDTEGNLWVRFESNTVGVGMSQDQWCDFARILLEQEGE